MQVYSNLSSLEELWNLDFENYAGLVGSLIITPLVLTLICLPDTAVFGVSWDRSILEFVFTLHHLVVVLEHTLLFAFLVGFLLTLDLFPPTLTSEFW